MKIAVVVFPGSNCDIDMYEAFHTVCKDDVEYVSYEEKSLDGFDVVVLPGGFSYGDYLRCGALARFSPIVKEVIAFARKGGLLVGICNGFQILTECGLLPGTLMMNENLHFICQHQYIRVETEASPFTQGIGKGKVMDIPIAHKEGNYYGKGKKRY